MFAPLWDSKRTYSESSESWYSNSPHRAQHKILLWPRPTTGSRPYWIKTGGHVYLTASNLLILCPIQLKLKTTQQTKLLPTTEHV